MLCLLVAGDTCGMSVPPLHPPGWHRERSQCVRLGLGSSHGWSPSWCLQAGCGREPAFLWSWQEKHPSLCFQQAAAPWQV